LACLIVCATFGVGTPAAFGATFTVNTTADTSDAGGCTTATVCSLRDAVAAGDAASGSTIDLPAGDYKLNTGASPLGQLDITTTTTIIGASARTTIVDGNGQSRVFDFEPGTSNTSDVLELEQLTVTGGSAPATTTGISDPGDGGGIFSLGGLDLQDVAVTANTAAESGGGIADGLFDDSNVPGPATLDGVTIASNHVTGGAATGQGGGALFATALAMTNSTVADNTVENPGVDIGGGLVAAPTSPLSGTQPVTATLTNDTITGNTAAEPLSSPVGDMGGGVSGYEILENTPVLFSAVLKATNTIIAGNIADGSEQDCALLDTTDETSSHNIEGDSTCGFTDSGSKQTMAVDLGALKDNGGPTNTSLPTSPTAPEVDAGTATGCPATDQRGVKRPQGSACDVGSVELALPTAVTGAATAITPTAATVSGTAGNPAVLAGTATFDYGTTTSYGHTASAGSATAGLSPVPVSAAASALTPNTTYHYRLTVTTTDGTATGADETFKTPTAPTTTSVSCSPHSLPAGRSTTCTATVANGAGGVTTAPTGTVKFSAPGFSGRCTLTGARCTAKLTVHGSPGARKVTASYAGNSIHAASSGSTTLTVTSVCPEPTGSTSGIHLGPAQLGLARAAERKRFHSYTTRGRQEFDFFCVDDHAGIRVGYASGRAVLILTSNPYYHLGKIRPGSTLSGAMRDLHIYAHFTLGLNQWYLAKGRSAAGVLKVRHGQVQEIGIAVRSQTRTQKAARHLFANIP
jgi:CSLREA domain-containing protein